VRLKLTDPTHGVSISGRLELAIELARSAGDVLLDGLESDFTISTKSSPFDLVTDIDRKSQETITSGIHESFPNDGVVAEEEGCTQRANNEWMWVIDPLDGTTNYVHKFPLFCVSIGVMHGDEPVVGVIFNPFLNELYVASKDSGESLNGKPIHVSKNDTITSSMLVTGFPYSKTSPPNNNFYNFVTFMEATRSIRRLGSAALDMAFVACGRLDGFWEVKLRPWDVAAGTVIIREAGGLVTNFVGEHFDIFSRFILASNGLIHDSMIEKLREAAENEYLQRSGQ